MNFLKFKKIGLMTAISLSLVVVGCYKADDDDDDCAHNGKKCVPGSGNAATTTDTGITTAPVSVELSGVVAEGSALGSATVKVLVDDSGTAAVTATTDANGKYTLKYSGAADKVLPAKVEVTKTVDGKTTTLRSFAFESGSTVNVNPITTAVANKSVGKNVAAVTKANFGTDLNTVVTAVYGPGVDASLFTTQVMVARVGNDSKPSAADLLLDVVVARGKSVDTLATSESKILTTNEGKILLGAVTAAAYRSDATAATAQLDKLTITGLADVKVVTTTYRTVITDKLSDVTDLSKLFVTLTVLGKTAADAVTTTGTLTDVANVTKNTAGLMVADLKAKITAGTIDTTNIANAVAQGRGYAKEALVSINAQNLTLTESITPEVIASKVVTAIVPEYKVRFYLTGDKVVVGSQNATISAAGAIADLTLTKNEALGTNPPNFSFSVLSNAVVAGNYKATVGIRVTPTTAGAKQYVNVIVEELNLAVAADGKLTLSLGQGKKIGITAANPAGTVVKATSSKSAADSLVGTSSDGKTLVINSSELFSDVAAKLTAAGSTIANFNAAGKSYDYIFYVKVTDQPADKVVELGVKPESFTEFTSRTGADFVAGDLIVPSGSYKLTGKYTVGE